MSLFAIADPHLSFTAGKPMDKFGTRWIDHTEKLEKNWRAVVSEEDTVVLPGDISWGINLEGAREDLAFLESLPGQKILGKGNHDYWWCTVSRMNAFLKQNNFRSIRFLHNNAYLSEGFAICGTRGWFVEEQLQKEQEGVDWHKLVAREAGRLRMSITDAEKKKKQNGSGETPLVFLHFPPVFRSFVCRELLDVLHEYNIRDCYYGHIHGSYDVPRQFEYEGIRMKVIAADHLFFVPMRILPEINE